MLAIREYITQEKLFKDKVFVVSEDSRRDQ